jgi:hypothetical protein
LVKEKELKQLQSKPPETVTEEDKARIMDLEAGFWVADNLVMIPYFPPE